MQLEISFLWYNDYVVKFDGESEKECWHAILVADKMIMMLISPQDDKMVMKI